MNKKLNYNNIIFSLTYFIGFIASLLFVNWSQLSFGELSFLIISISLANISVMTGWHRYFTHRHFKTYSFIEFLFLFFGSSIFAGSVLEWMSEHMSHHANEGNEEKDPTSTKRGFFYSHMGWIFYKQDIKLRNDPRKLVKWHHKNWLWFSFLSGVIFPVVSYYLLFGNLFNAIFLGVFFRTFVSQQSLFLVGSWSHFFGQKDGDLKTSATNSLVVSFFCFGEGYHLNHHLNPNDYRAGKKWYNYDPGKWFIYTLEKLNLAWDLKRTN